MFNHIVIPKANHAIVVLGKLGRSFVVFQYLVGMLATIEFDHQLLFRTGEVGNTIADRVLTTKFQKREFFA
jgi:hypothetical protein